MIRYYCLLFFVIGCDTPKLPGDVSNAEPKSAQQQAQSEKQKTQSAYHEARENFKTNLVSRGESSGPPEQPAGGEFELVRYPSPVGDLAAYLTPDPRDGKRHAAIIWITGGDTNSIGDVWSPNDRSNDQSARAFRERGIIMMFPSQRGGNDNPGRREGFLGEVDDIMAATDYLVKLPYVDPNRVYLGGHSTGGTLAMLVGAYSDRYTGIISLGPVADARQYGGAFVYCDPENENEIVLRSPLYWLDSVNSPMYVIEGENGNWDGAVELMQKKNNNQRIQFFRVPNHDHFTVIAPITELLAEQILQGQVSIDEVSLRNIR